MLMYVHKQSGYNIEYINKLPIFETLELLKVLKSIKKDGQK